MLLVFLFGVVAAAGQQPTRPYFRSAVDLVSLSVTVTGQQSRYVTDLEAHEFTILEDGVPQEIAFFSKTPVPIALALLIDTSGSMHAHLRMAQEAAIGFVRSLGPDDQAAVIEFDSRVSVLQDFTDDREALEHAILSTRAKGSTSIYNAIYVALRELERTGSARSDDEIRRHAIVVLSDGEDTSSLIDFDDALDLAKRSQTAIYTIGLRASEPPRRGGGRDSEFVLRRFARETGGRSFFPDRVSELAGVYGEISRELSSQYTLAYASHNHARDGAWRRLEVRISRPNAVARAKFGYYAPGAN